MSNIIIHVSDINISTNTGMGRVEYYWKQAFEKSNFNFIHIGNKEVGELTHPALFPYKAYQFYRRLNIKPRAFIVHEPAAGCFVQKGVYCFVESHGVERRYWEAQLNGSVPGAGNINFKTRMLFPLWRLSGCDKGLKYAEKLLLIHSEDKEYVKTKYRRQEKDIMIYRNGISHISITPGDITLTNRFTILFNGSWIERKGIRTLIKSAELLQEQGLNIQYLLIGTGKDTYSVLSDWPENLRSHVKVIPHFAAEEESDYLQAASLFVLPSYSEGQPLSLLQAMAAGKCCITTNCCGQKDIIENNRTGLFFTAGDYKNLAMLINNCYHNVAMSDKIGKNAKQYVQNLTWEKVSDEVVSFITSSLSNNRKPVFNLN